MFFSKCLKMIECIVFFDFLKLFVQNHNAQDGRHPSTISRPSNLKMTQNLNVICPKCLVLFPPGEPRCCL